MLYEFPEAFETYRYCEPFGSLGIVEIAPAEINAAPTVDVAAKVVVAVAIGYVPASEE